MSMFRALNADEIDCRISQIKEKDGKPSGLSLLLYKDARCDQNILDETVGEYNWKREHTRDNRNCIVSLWDDKKQQWISKEDTGTESNTEKEKGLASDSFKRACFNWGIGRELYTAPFIWIDAKDCTIKKGMNGKWQCYDNFTVNAIATQNGKIVGLKIKNEKVGRIVFNWGMFPAPNTNTNQNNSVAPDYEPTPDPAQEHLAKKDAPATVTVQSKLPEDAIKKPVNPVLNYLANEKAFMSQRLEIVDDKQMNAWFSGKVASLVKSGAVENTPYTQMTMDQAKNLVDAIYKTFLTDGGAA